MIDVSTLSAETLALLGLASAALSTLAFAPYIRDTLTGATQPQRASWLIWTVLSNIAFWAQVAEGAEASLWFAGTQAGGTTVIFLLSLRKGTGELLSRPDERILWIAALGVVVWYFTDTAEYALAMTITISLLGGSLTVLKAYRDPGSETLLCWALGFAASCCALISVGTVDPVLLAYPAYLFVLYSAIIGATVLGRVKDRAAPPATPAQ
ncbi:MAG: hypothetical protein AAF218_00930 [Pseudomonadota bacterium]